MEIKDDGFLPLLKEDIESNCNTLQEEQEKEIKVKETEYYGADKTDVFLSIRKGEIIINYPIEILVEENSIAIIYGESGCGKSTLCKCLLLAFAYGLDKYLGYKINSDNRNVFLVSTEETEKSVLSIIQKQAKDFEPLRTIENPNYKLFSCVMSEIDVLLEKIMSENQYGLGCIDTPQDFCSNLNDNSIVRILLRKIRNLADKYHCPIILVFHMNKNTSDLSPDLDNLNGSSAIRAVGRTICELRENPINPNQAILSLMKCSNIEPSIRENSKILEITPNRTFIDTEKTIPTKRIHLTFEYKKDIRNDVEERVIELLKEGNLSQIKIAELINKEFPNSGKKYLQYDISVIKAKNIM